MKKFNLSLMGLFALAAPGWAIESGEQVAGDISPVGDSDTFSFSGEVGEEVRIGMGETGGNGFTPFVELLDSSGGVVASAVGNVSAFLSLQLPATGSYTIRVSESGNNSTGSYELNLMLPKQGFQASSDSGVIANGGDQSGSLSLGDFDAWSFNAVQGEAIRLGMGEVSGNGFTPVVELFDSDGQLLASGTGNTGAAIATTATRSGRYIAVVSEANTDNAGGYSLSLGLATGTVVASADSGALANGRDVMGALPAGDIDVWSFNAVAGSSIRAAVGEVSGNGFVPQIELFAPNGALLELASDSTGTAIFANASLSGQYVVMVSDASKQSSGSYRLTVGVMTEEFASDRDGGILVSGRDVSGSLPFGDSDIWTFEATAGQAIRLGMGELSGNGFAPQLELFGPDGQQAATSADNDGAFLAVTASQTGQYAVMVSDFGFNSFGDYELSFVLAPSVISPSGDSGVLVNAVDVSGSIPLGDYDAWTFEAEVGDAIRIGMGETTGNGFFPEIELFNPLGQRVGQDTGGDGANVAITASVAGRYTVVLSDSGNNNAGGYQLAFGRIPAAFDAVGDSGVLTPTEDRSGSLPFGDYDFWSFEANQGDAIRIGLGETSGNGFFPQIELFDPNGQRVGDDFDGEGAFVSVTASQSGTYVAVVSDAGNDNAGNYTIALALPPQAFTPSGDSGFLMAGETVNGSLAVGDLDTRVISAIAGDELVFSLAETTGNGFFPLLELFSGDGTLLRSSFNASALTIRYRVPSDGLYFLIVRDFDANNPGSYQLSGDGFTGGAVVFPLPSAEGVPELSLNRIENGLLELSWETTTGVSAWQSEDLVSWEPLVGESESNGISTFEVDPIGKGFFQLRQN